MKAYLFDIDGVLTDLESKRVIKPELFDELANRINQGYRIGLNTGRSAAFIITEILEPLKKHLASQSILQNVISVGEMGGVVITCDARGKQSVEVDHTICVPSVLQQKIRALINQAAFNKYVFFDESKQAMISLELKLGKTIAEFEQPKHQLMKAIEAILRELTLTEIFVVASTKIAVDIHEIHMGKALGARKFITLAHPQQVICFGDSPSDYTMYEECERQHITAEFVYVGDRHSLADKPQSHIIYPRYQFDAGVLFYLQSEERFE